MDIKKRLFLFLGLLAVACFSALACGFSRPQPTWERSSKSLYDSFQLSWQPENLGDHWFSFFPELAEMDPSVVLAIQEIQLVRQPNGQLVWQHLNLDFLVGSWAAMDFMDQWLEDGPVAEDDLEEAMMNSEDIDWSTMEGTRLLLLWYGEDDDDDTYFENILYVFDEPELARKGLNQLAIGQQAFYSPKDWDRVAAHMVSSPIRMAQAGWAEFLFSHPTPEHLELLRSEFKSGGLPSMGLYGLDFELWVEDGHYVWEVGSDYVFLDYEDTGSWFLSLARYQAVVKSGQSYSIEDLDMEPMKFWLGLESKELWKSWMKDQFSRSISLYGGSSPMALFYFTLLEAELDSGETMDLLEKLVLMQALSVNGQETPDDWREGYSLDLNPEYGPVDGKGVRREAWRLLALLEMAQEGKGLKKGHKALYDLNTLNDFSWELPGAMPKSEGYSRSYYWDSKRGEVRAKWNFSSGY